MSASTDICTANSASGRRCRNRATIGDLCSVHAGAVDMARLSQKGVEARRARPDDGDYGKAKLKRAIRRRFAEQADDVARTLLRTPAGVERGFEMGFGESASVPRNGGGGQDRIILLHSAFETRPRDPNHPGVDVIYDPKSGQTRLLPQSVPFDSLQLLEDYVKELDS